MVLTRMPSISVPIMMAASLNLHDSCGVNNLHGIPGILGGVLSIGMAALAKEEHYGMRLMYFWFFIAKKRPRL